MNHLRRILAAAATQAAAVLALTITPPLSPCRSRRPAKAAASHPHPPPVVITDGGMPGWQITLIALAAALAAALCAVFTISRGESSAGRGCRHGARPRRYRGIS